ncbi:MAG TPA: sigma-54 dependent transcriptional regulator [Anaeromyxobacteraceae bacterium]|nr:sigma-54 dependent transcriptional regulator [Anaeromyxobacteraceae bacterium]
MPRLKVLLVEDDALVRRSLRGLLESAGHEVAEAEGVRAALQALQGSAFDVTIVDHHLADGSSLDLLGALPAADIQVPIIVVTGHGTIDLAVSAMKRGAYHFVSKPPPPAELLRLVEAAAAERSPGRRTEGVDPFAGSSEAIRSLAAQARRLLGAASPVLIQGETGTGKGLVARWIHDRSPRAGGPFVDVNCAGLSGELLDSELFGHERGAFTGAVAAKAGLFEVANGGTLFLDEIGDVSLAVQAKILKVVEERRFRRVGGVEDRSVDIRLLAATNQDLAGLAAAGTFRADLYYRISALPLAVPPLRDRADDVLLLARRILADFGPARAGGVSLAPDAVEALRAYRWPGNVRELRNVLERAVLLTDRAELRAEHLRLDAGKRAGPAQAAVTLGDLEREHIERTLAGVGYRVREAAERLGIPRSTLYQRIKAHGIVLPRSRR